jgi:hypothetical protein
MTQDDNTTLISDSHTAMEFYQFANATDDFFELSTTTLAHLYFIKVLVKPAEYNSMDTIEKNEWDQSKMSKIQKKSKKILIQAITKAVRVSCDIHQLV